jgi:hypothetical protein
MAAQRMFGIALGYEDLIDHCQLRHDGCWQTSPSKSMLKRLEHAPAGPRRYHKNGLIRTRSMACSSISFSEAHRTPLKRSVLDLDATDDSLRQEVIY